MSLASRLTPSAQSTGLMVAHRRASRSVFVAILLVSMVALLAAGASYLDDASRARASELSALREVSHLRAEALALHLSLLSEELLRLASRSEMDPQDASSRPERELLETSHHGSALFGLGISVLRLDGHVEWSEPAYPMLGPGALPLRPWFQQVLQQQGPVVDALAPDSNLLAVAVPIIRKGLVTGVLLGVVEAARTSLVQVTAPKGQTRELILLDSRETPLLPHSPAWAHSPTAVGDALDAFSEERSGSFVAEGRELLGAAAAVGTTGLTLILVGDAAALAAGPRARLFAQMVGTAAVLLLSLLLFSLFLRKISRTLLKVEARAMHQEKMAALGTASTLIAHEVKNALHALWAVASVLEGSGALALPVQTMRGQLDRLQHLARSLLYFGKPTSPPPVAVELAPLVMEVVKGLQMLPEAGELQLLLTLEAGLVVRSDPTLLHSAVDNLLRNAMEAAVAAKDIGKVTAPRVQVVTRLHQGRVQVEVDDNAGGLPPEAEAQLFQPFFTSKAKGIGLGLAMAQMAVESHGGQLRYTRTAEGSQFTISMVPELPR